MTERELIQDRRPAGARIYDAAGGAERELRKPIAADDTRHDEARPRHDPNLANILTIILVAVLVLGFVFGLVILSSVF
ncbi:MAG TPA: hypothetical protein PKD53_07465 [Chloroflexaceae bacterium]|nr:hypothetical protein [Chloroflexaceae bacterium]